MKTEMEKAFDCLVDIFHQYCLLDKKNDELEIKEFEKLMNEQGAEFLKRTMPPNLDKKAYIKQLFDKSDKNKNGRLEFPEWNVVLVMAMNDAHDRSHELGGHGGPGHCHSHDDGSVHCH